MAAKLLEGTYRADRDGPVEGAVRAVGAPQPPADLDGEALAYWHRIVPGLVASGVAAACDSEALGLLCWWLEQLHRMRADIDRRWTAAEASGAPANLGHALVAAGIATDKFNQLASRFGLTPSDRAKLRVEPQGPPQTPVPPRKR